MIGSVGGVELLYPILEQVHLPVRKRTESKNVTGNHLEAAASKPSNEDESPSLSPPPQKESPTNLEVGWWFDGM